MSKSRNDRHRIYRRVSSTLQNWRPPEGPEAKRLKQNVVVQCGWGRLLLAHTFIDGRELIETLSKEKTGCRDIAMYVRDPHVLLAMDPQTVFLDPSHTYRIWLSDYRPSLRRPRGYMIRSLRRKGEVDAINRIYKSRKMVRADPDFLWRKRTDRVLLHYVAVDQRTQKVIGTVTGIDHRQAYNEPENGSSLWCLAVDSQAPHLGVGEALVRYLIEQFAVRGRAYMDLSVIYDNKQAIALYDKLGFRRVPAFCVKRKNPINEPLFVASAAKTGMNPYAEIIVQEARRRGVGLRVLDKERAYFELDFGGRKIRCRESLSDLTSGVAMGICDDKILTNRWLKKAGFRVPAQRLVGRKEDDFAFLSRHRRLVVKPVRGEQGAGISVDIRTRKDLAAAIEKAHKVHSGVLLEKYVEGEDLRMVVIGYRFVAAAVRRPPQIVGNGSETIERLVEKLSRRRSMATRGESRIVVDDETRRCIKMFGYQMSSVLPAGRAVVVRKTANLHTGGTIHDVTGQVHRSLIRAAEDAARAIDIPVVGFDFIVPKVDGPRYVILEANERVGLANHEPQPTAERFLDFLFPLTVSSPV